MQALYLTPNSMYISNLEVIETLHRNGPSPLGTVLVGREKIDANALAATLQPVVKELQKHGEEVVIVIRRPIYRDPPGKKFPK